MVQPSVLWPVLKATILYAVRPTTGVPSGIIGRRPVVQTALLQGRRAGTNRAPPSPGFR